MPRLNQYRIAVNTYFGDGRLPAQYWHVVMGLSRLFILIDN